MRKFFPKKFSDFNQGKIGAGPPWYGARAKIFDEKFSPVEWASVPKGGWEGFLVGEWDRH
jgi:hypothetical protein